MNPTHGADATPDPGRPVVDVSVSSGADSPRLLLISPAFFGYELVMARALDDAGLRVLYLDERPSNSVIGRGLARVAPRLLANQIARHYAQSLMQLKDEKIDHVVIVKGEIVPPSFIREIRTLNPKARITYYAYDKLHHSDNYFRFRDLVDTSLSFDRKDVEELPEFSYRPLFFSPEFTPGKPHADRTFDVSTVATVNPDRYRKVHRVLDATSSARVHLYTPSKAYLAARRILDRSYREIDLATVSARSLSRSEVAEYFRDSRIVVDAQKPGQTGLTIRTLEALATGASLLTWNSAVVEEPFYDPARVHVLRDDSPEAVAEGIAHLRSSPQDGTPPKSGFGAYSATRWAGDILAS